MSSFQIPKSYYQAVRELILLHEDQVSRFKEALQQLPILLGREKITSSTSKRPKDIGIIHAEAIVTSIVFLHCLLEEVDEDIRQQVLDNIVNLVEKEPELPNLTSENIKQSLYTIAFNRHILPIDKSNLQTFQDDLKLREKFEKLANNWYEETCGFSSITKKITNFNYLKIIALGQAVVPLILHSLAQKPDHWFVALKALTDQDPVESGDNFEQAVEAWLKWGKKEGLI
jgi:hypothetical protein